MNKENNEDQVFVRIDLDKTSGNTAYYRLDEGLKDFLNKCKEKHEIEAVILTQENGQYHWNIGIVLKEK